MHHARIAGSLTAAMLAFSASNPALAIDCGKQLPTKYNGKVVREADGALLFQSAVLQVDADGAPNSYRVDGNGLSYTCDGVTAVGSTPDTDPEGWQKKCRDAWKKARETGNYSGVRIFGFATDGNNTPIIQASGDPLPGDAYISTTSVEVPDGPSGTQRRFVNANEIPYIVLSKAFVRDFKVGPGDVVLVYRPAKDKFALGVYADGGKLGEASVKLHQDLGSDPMIDKGGVKRAKRGLDDKTLTMVFAGQNTKRTVDSVKWRAEIAEKGKKLLAGWGGIERVKACAN